MFKFVLILLPIKSELMNILKIVFFTLIICSVNAFGQNGFGQNNNAFNRDIGNVPQNSSKPSTEEIEKIRSKRMDDFMNKLKSDLTLDELQYIAIKQGINNNNKNIDIFLKKENSEEEKAKGFKAFMDKIDEIINSYLNKDQKEKYKVLSEENKATNNKVKKSKKKVEDKEKVE
jgi:hypothetical protein